MKNPLSNFLDFIKAQHTENYLKGTLVAVLAICLCTVLSLNTCYSVSVDGKEIGYITSNQTFNSALAEAKAITEAETGLVLTDLYNNVTVEKVHVLFAGKMDTMELASTLNEHIEWLTKGTILNIENGNVQFALRSHEEGQKVLDTLFAENTQAASNVIIKSVGFLEDVRLEDTNVRLSQLTTAEEALTVIKQGKEAMRTHAVVEGESLWSIANNNNLSVEELKTINPQLTTERLQIGQELTLTKLEPLVNVVITKEVSSEEVIAFETEYQDTDKLLRGENEITTAGQDGKKVVTYEIKEANGIALEKNLLSEVVLAEPVKEVVSKGTSSVMVASSRGGSGALTWPIGNRRINSPFGGRSRGYHTGLDIAAKTGDTVSAAAGGKVVSSGWAGGYGYCVVLDHGNGLKTRYAHLSATTVSAGQTVLRGEQVGRAGSTGNSTGAHLHFEVIVNGETKNPSNYLN